jgi:hypothetical protein
MRVVAIATILLFSSLGPSFAEDQGQPPTPNQPQTVPVQPERSPNQSQQSGEDSRGRVDDRQVGRDWRVRPSDSERMGRTGQNEMGPPRDRMRSDMDSERGTVGRDWRRDYDRAERGYREDHYDEDRPRRRIKVCVEYENGDEYCHNR